MGNQRPEDEFSRAALKKTILEGRETIGEVRSSLTALQAFLSDPLYDRLQRLAQIVNSETLSDSQKVKWAKRELKGL